MPLDTLLPNRLETCPDASMSGACSAWCVVNTNPQAERWAALNLTKAGYPTYLPLMRVRRRDPVVRTLSRLVDVPLFAGYCFVIAGTHWAPIKHLPGIARLLMCDGRPGRVRPGFVEALRASEIARQSVAEPDRWAPGSACRLAHGAFAGHAGVVTAVARDAARVGLLMFGALREVDVPLDALEPR